MQGMELSRQTYQKIPCMPMLKHGQQGFIFFLIQYFADSSER